MSRAVGGASKGDIPPQQSVFLNLPFDAKHRRTYVALICGLTTLGLLPRLVSESVEPKDRLSRLLELIGKCSFSIHDLSYISRSTLTDRLNMPFELGLAIAWRSFGNAHHRWWCLERKKYELISLLSDLGGHDFYIHDAKPRGVFRFLANVFERSAIGIQDMEAVYREVNEQLVRPWLQVDRNRNVYTGDSFRALVLKSTAIAERMRRLR